MGKKINKWDTLFKGVEEKFELLSYEDCNEIFKKSVENGGELVKKTSVPYVQVHKNIVRERNMLRLGTSHQKQRCWLLVKRNG